MMQHKLLLILLALLLITVGVVAAESSSTPGVQRYVTSGGGTADSAHFGVVSVVGQPATNRAGSSNYQVSGGFLFPRRTGLAPGEHIWLPLIRK